jgi:hypothetical protein
MRLNQVSITIERYSKVADEPVSDGKWPKINVYADANNLYEALAAANYETLGEIQKRENTITPEKYYQVYMFIERFGDTVPVSARVENSKRQRIYGDADKNSVYEALSAANYEVLREIQKYETLPSFGCKEHYERSSSNS